MTGTCQCRVNAQWCIHCSRGCWFWLTYLLLPMSTKICQLHIGTCKFLQSIRMQLDVLLPCNCAPQVCWCVVIFFVMYQSCATSLGATLICNFLCHLKVQGCDQYADKFILAVETAGADDTADSVISSILFRFVTHTMQRQTSSDPTQKWWTASPLSPCTLDSSQLVKCYAAWPWRIHTQHILSCVTRHNLLINVRVPQCGLALGKICETIGSTQYQTDWYTARSCRHANKWTVVEGLSKLPSYQREKMIELSKVMVIQAMLMIGFIATCVLHCHEIWAIEA